MFKTFELQNLNKLTKCQVRDFTSPKAFHSFQVQRFKGKCIKASTKVSRQFPMPILALPTDFPIQSCELSDSMPPIIRTFFLTRKAFIELAKLFQGLFQELRRLYLFACGKRQESVFHSEVCTYTFTRSGQGFGSCIVSNDVKLVFTHRVAKDLDIANISVPTAVLMERKSPSPKLQTLRLFVPLFEREGDITFFKFVTRLELRRPITPFPFELWKADGRIVECALVGEMDTNNHSVKRVTGYPRPMFFSPFEQLCQMWL